MYQPQPVAYFKQDVPSKILGGIMRFDCVFILL
jgi:hypothetical protein